MSDADAKKIIEDFDESMTLLGSILTKADKAFMDNNVPLARTYVWYARRLLDPKAAALAEEYDPVFAALVRTIDEARPGAKAGVP